MLIRAFLIFIYGCLPTWGSAAECPKAILVTGGAGYIGTQTCKALKEAGFLPIVYDNFSRTSPEPIQWGVLAKGDISDRKKLAKVIDRYKPVAVIHLAGFKAVGESIQDPAKYYLNNLSGSLILLDVMREKGIHKIIFSSTAAVYGSPQDQSPFRETQPCAPINPYGTSKWMVEKILQDFQAAYGFEYVIFRYFNVAGADLNKSCGERGKTAMNLIPIIVQVAMQKRKELEVFGSDYSTPDGTAIRDYIHVVDLADAHVKGLHYLLEGKPSVTLNLGTGRGASVQEVIAMAGEITQKPIPLKMAPRRAGDPAHLTADSQLAKTLLKWEPKHSDLKTILETEWQWKLDGLEEQKKSP
jgi:UDP-arabinose 4-epimerase